MSNPITIHPLIVAVLSALDNAHRAKLVSPEFVWAVIHNKGYRGPEVRAALPSMLIFELQDKYHAEKQAQAKAEATSPDNRVARKAAKEVATATTSAIVSQPLYQR